jgi:hypothetical protein
MGNRKFVGAATAGDRMTNRALHSILVAPFHTAGGDNQ